MGLEQINVDDIQVMAPGDRLSAISTQRAVSYAHSADHSRSCGNGGNGLCGGCGGTGGSGATIGSETTSPRPCYAVPVGNASGR